MPARFRRGTSTNETNTAHQDSTYRFGADPPAPDRRVRPASVLCWPRDLAVT